MVSLDIFSIQWILVSLAVVFASFVRGVSGFGLILVLAPILLLILSPTDVVVITLLLGLMSNSLVIFYFFKNINLMKILPIAVSSTFGIPVGAWIITTVSPSTLKVIIGGVTVASAILLSLGLSKKFKREKLVSSIAGLISGVLASSTGMSGPPVVLFMHNQNWERELIQSSLAIYFSYANIVSLLALGVSGLVNIPVIISAVSLIPALLAGLGLGIVVFRRLNTRYFRLITIAIVIVTGILGILSGFGVLS